MHRLRKLQYLSRVAAIAVTLGLLSQLTIMVIVGSNGSALLSMQLAGSYEGFMGVLNLWSPEHFDTYWAHIGPDLVHPVLYSLAILFALAWALERAQLPERWSGLLWFPPIGGLLDEIENAVHMIGVARYPDVPYWSFAIGNTAAYLKWTICLSMILMIPIVLWLGRRRG